METDLLENLISDLGDIVNSPEKAAKKIKQVRRLHNNYKEELGRKKVRDGRSTMT